MMATSWLLLLLPAAGAVIYDVFSGRPVGEHKPTTNTSGGLTDQMRLFFGIRPWCTLDIPECSPFEPRRVDGSCNNLQRPPRGATLTPYHRMLPSNHAVNGGLRTSTTGEPLPSARPLRVSLMSDGRVHSDRYTQLMTYIGVVITGDVTSIHDTVNYVIFTTSCCRPGGRLEPSCMPVDVPPDDLHLRYSGIRCLNLTRAITYQRIGCASPALPPERINTSPPLLDLSIMYGNDRGSSDRARLLSGGLLRTELFNGKEWPPGGSPVCILNQPPEETYCFNAGNVAMNALVGVQLITLWLHRNHNQLARSLQLMNPCWSDERLFHAARDINIAYYQHIIYYDLMPALLGAEVLLKNGVIYQTHHHVDDYDDTLEPTVSIEYVIGTRWFHSMQEGRLQLFDGEGKLFDEFRMVDYILRTGALRNSTKLAGITQGAFRQPSADNDHLYDPEVGERILGPLQTASDVSSSDIMKGRDVGLSAYNRYRSRCGLPAARATRDLHSWIPKDLRLNTLEEWKRRHVEGTTASTTRLFFPDVVSAFRVLRQLELDTGLLQTLTGHEGFFQADVLERSYSSVEDVDLMAAILVEKPMPGAVMGPTLACIMIDQLLRWRRSDRFWYENSIHPGAFTEDQLNEVRKMSMARLICEHGDSVDSIQPYAFLLPSPGNEITNCSNIPRPNLEPWRDQSCSLKNIPMSPTTTHFNVNEGI